MLILCSNRDLTEILRYSRELSYSIFKLILNLPHLTITYSILVYLLDKSEYLYIQSFNLLIRSADGY